ncbi:CDGSH iron-sulfur domain-containing protein [Nonomuraea basaltis]|nr:CDGSH iron-sulfur domain-containing protein [Nonomuraea basaltis]
MLADTGDSDVRSGVMGRIDHCPSGSYSYALERGGDTIEPDLPQAISVLEEEDGLASALWVTGGVPVLRADGRPLEPRNRMTLCRCGHSGNKPLCDGTHREIGFREEGPARQGEHRQGSPAPSVRAEQAGGASAGRRLTTSKGSLPPARPCDGASAGDEGRWPTAHRGG